MSPPTVHERRFADYLATLAAGGDRGALAALRRGLGKAPGEAAEMHRYVVPWLPQDPRPWQEEAYYLVAALFAWHQGSWRPDGNVRGPTKLGASLARLAEHRRLESVERRFTALLNCHREAMPDHLRGAIGLLRTAEVPVDWAQLLHDIQRWDWESRAVQREWARAFWGAAAPPEESEAEQETPAAETAGA